MQRFIVFLLILIALGGIYNLRTVRDSFFGLLGDTSYRNEDFSSAEAQYKNLLRGDSGSTLQEADILYNLGNTLYRLGEQEKDKKKMTFWKEAIGNYTKSLSLRTDQETEENLAFVKEKLQEEQKAQEKTKKEQEEQEKKEDEERSGS